MRKKSNREMEVAEALNFIKVISKQVPPGNQIILGFLAEKEQKLHEELFDAVIERSRKGKRRLPE